MVLINVYVMLNGNVAWLWSICMGTLLFPSLLTGQYIYIIFVLVFVKPTCLLSMLSHSLTYTRPNLLAHARCQEATLY